MRVTLSESSLLKRKLTVRKSVSKNLRFVPRTSYHVEIARIGPTHRPQFGVTETRFSCIILREFAGLLSRAVGRFSG